jgi:hypothetical protein
MTENTKAFWSTVRESGGGETTTEPTERPKPRNKTRGTFGRFRNFSYRGVNQDSSEGKSWTLVFDDRLKQE